MKEINTITKREMKEAIERSGYLLEQRVEAILEKRGYYVSTNAPYPDPMTGKSREIDIDAMKVHKVSKEYDLLWCRLLCECENNAQPVVLFVQSYPSDYLPEEVFKCAGTPVKFICKSDIYKTVKVENGATFVDLFNFLKIDKFHHYNKGAIATQYCSFTRKNKNKPWLAYHSDTQHETFTSLINALEANIDDFYNSYFLPEEDEIEQMNIEIYYLVLILQGPLYAASTVGRKLNLVRSKHLQYRKEIFSRDRRDTYQIDVITEKFLPQYLIKVEEEMKKINNRLKRKKKLARASMDLLIEAAKRKSKEQSYREIFEF